MAAPYDSYEERVLILATAGNDAALAESVLSQAGISTLMCPTVSDLCRDLGDGAGALLLVQEALPLSDIPALVSALRNQPTWSDVPIALLAPPAEGYDTSLQSLDMFKPAGNLTLLERPLQTRTLINALQVALRARHCQYQVRDLLKKLEVSQSELLHKIEDLERFEQVVVGRELKMMELERENQKLKRALDHHTTH